MQCEIISSRNYCSLCHKDTQLVVATGSRIQFKSKRLKVMCSFYRIRVTGEGRQCLGQAMFEANCFSTKPGRLLAAWPELPVVRGTS